MPLRKALHLAFIAALAVVLLTLVGVGVTVANAPEAGAQTGGAIIPCSIHGVPVTLQYPTQTYVQWYDIGAPPYYSTVQQANQCRTTSGGNCHSLSGGFWTGRPHGINGGPHYRIHMTATGNFGSGNVRTWTTNVYAERTDY